MSPKRYRFDRDVGGGRCAACQARILRDSYVVQVAGTEQVAYVHFECSRRVAEAGAEGYQPPKGGPRLVAYEHWTRGKDVEHGEASKREED